MWSLIAPLQNSGDIETESEGIKDHIPCKLKSKGN